MRYEDHPLFWKPPLIGYRGICKNRDISIVYKEEAVEYALNKLGYERNPYAEPDEQMTKEFESMLVEWFYSGDWVEVREGEENEW